MREQITVVSFLLLATLPTGCGAPATRLNVDPETRVAIDGWDPVSYRPEGGGAPQKGDPRWTAEHDGAVYQFASPAHRDLFGDGVHLRPWGRCDGGTIREHQTDQRKQDLGHG